MVSIVATETTAVTFLSVPGNATRADMTFLQLAFGSFVATFAVIWMLLPSDFEKHVYTAYQVLELRFGGATQKAAAVLFLMTRTLASGLRLYRAAVVLKTITDWSLPVSIVVIGLSTLAYAYFGGIKAVVWIDFLQFAVYLIAALVAMGIVLGEVPGGWEDIWRASTLAVAEVTSNVKMRSDPACLFIDTSTPDGRATGLVRDSVAFCLVLVTVHVDTVDQVLGTLSPNMKQKLNDCLKAALALP